MIITYIILQAFVITKYSSVIFISNLWKFYDILIHNINFHIIFISANLIYF